MHMRAHSITLGYCEVKRITRQLRLIIYSPRAPARTCQKMLINLPSCRENPALWSLAVSGSGPGRALCPDIEQGDSERSSLQYNAFHWTNIYPPSPTCQVMRQALGTQRWRSQSPGLLSSPHPVRKEDPKHSSTGCSNQGCACSSTRT